MMQGDKFLAVDLKDTREKGFEYFIKSEAWPVGEEEFHKFHNDTMDLYNNIVSNVDDEFFDIALVETTFVSNIIDICHYNYIQQYCLIENINLNHGEESSPYLKPDWQFLGCYYLDLYTVYNKIKGFVKNNIKNIVFNRHLSIGNFVQKFIMGSGVVGIGSNDRIKQEYITKHKIFCDNRDINYFIKKAIYSFSKNESSYNKSRVYSFIHKEVVTPFILGMQDTDSLFIKGIEWKVIEKVWMQRFLDAYRIYKGLYLIDIPKVLLVSEVAKPYSKLITLAFQRKGCKVINFHHGNSAAWLNLKWGYQSLFSHCDNYVVETEVMRIRFEKLLHDTQINIRAKATNFISLDSRYYSNIRKQQNHIDSKVVMLMGYPMNLTRYATPYDFFYYKLPLEHMLAEIFKIAGFSVCYKVHPDRLKEAGSIMNGVTDKFESLPFEEVWRNAGVLVFTYISTTTFGYALNLPVPIVIIEVPGVPWYKNMRELVENRAAIVQANISGGRINVDHNELISAIDIAKSRINLDIAKEIIG